MIMKMAPGFPDLPLLNVGSHHVQIDFWSPFRLPFLTRLSDLEVLEYDDCQKNQTD
jgi:hypothetical protein